MLNLSIPIYATIACTISLLALLPGNVQAQSKSWNTDYVADDTFFVLALNVEKLVESIKGDDELFDKMKQSIEREMRMEIASIKQFQLVMGAEEEDLAAEEFDEEDTLEVKLMFKEDQNIEELVQGFFRSSEFEKVEHDGVEYYKLSRSYRPSIHAPDNRTLIIANDRRLKKLIETPKTMGNFVDRLGSADGEAEVFLAFENNRVLDEVFMKELARELDGLPFNLRDIAAEAKHGELTMNLDSKKPIVGQIVNKDAAGAERVKRAADALIALGKIGLAEGKKALAKDDQRIPEEFRKLAKEGVVMGESLLGGAKFTTREEKLNIECTADTELKSAVKIFTMMLFRANMASAAPVEIGRDDAADKIKEDAIKAVEKAKEAAEKAREAVEKIKAKSNIWARQVRHGSTF